MSSRLSPPFGPRCTCDAGRLVDHQHQAVAVEQARHHLFRGHGETAITGASNERKRAAKLVETAVGGLKRTSTTLGTAITDLVSKRKLDAAAIDEIEEALIRADLGVETAARITEAMAEGRYEKDIAPDEVKAVLAGEVEKVLSRSRSRWRSTAQAVRHSGGRRQRLRQDHDDRQARGEVSAEGKPCCSPPATRSAPPRSTS